MKYNLNPDSINYIKMVYKDDNDFTHCIKAGVKDVNERDICAGAKFEEGFVIKTPKNVELSIITDTGLYKAKTEIKYLTKEPPYVFFCLRTPVDLEYLQNREFFRVKMNENATILYLENENDEKQIACETYDISANGVRIVIDKKVEFPEIVSIILYLYGRDVKTDAKFVRTDEDDGILKYSFYFENIKENDLDYISQICLKKQLEQRRNHI